MYVTFCKVYNAERAHDTFSSSLQPENHVILPLLACPSSAPQSSFLYEDKLLYKGLSFFKRSQLDVCHTIACVSSSNAAFALDSSASSSSSFFSTTITTVTTTTTTAIITTSSGATATAAVADTTTATTNATHHHYHHWNNYTPTTAGAVTTTTSTTTTTTTTTTTSNNYYYGDDDVFFFSFVRWKLVSAPKKVAKRRRSSRLSYRASGPLGRGLARSESFDLHKVYLDGFIAVK